MTPQRQSQFTPKMKANTVPRLLSSLAWIDQYNERNGMTSFMEFIICGWLAKLTDGHKQIPLMFNLHAVVLSICHSITCTLFVYICTCMFCHVAICLIKGPSQWWQRQHERWDSWHNAQGTFYLNSTKECKHAAECPCSYWFQPTWLKVLDSNPGLGTQKLPQQTFVNRNSHAT